MKFTSFILAASAATMIASGAASAEDLQKMRVQLGGIPLPGYTAPLYYAKAEGLYEKAGLDVEIIPGKVSQTSINAVTAGGADIALVAAQAAITVADKGQKLVIVGSALGRDGSGVFTDQDKELKSLSDLEGKTILFPNPPSEQLTRALMTKSGADESKMKSIQVAQVGTMFGMYISGQADGALSLVLAAPVFAQGRPSSLLGLDQYGVSSPMFAWATSPEALEAKEEALRAFLRVTYEATGALNENPELAIDSFVASVPGAKAETVVPGYNLVLGYQCAPGETIVGRMSDKAWKDAVDLYKSVGQVSEDFDVTSIYTNAFFDTDTVSNVECPQ